MHNSSFRVKFWGVRGSLPVPGPSTVQYGGNTSCIELMINNRLFILDAGTGLYRLGNELISHKHTVQGDIFISHTHWDHIQGIPFFAPFYNPHNQFNIYGQDKAEMRLEQILSDQMAPVYFPVSLQQMEAQINFKSLLPGQILEFDGGIRVSTMVNCHPGEVMSYRFDYEGIGCCYLTDTEHNPAYREKNIDFIKNSALLIYDCTFTDEEYASYIGYGHSTWQEGIRLAKASNVKELVLFHHASFRTDSQLKQIELQAQKLYPHTRAAREEMVIDL